MIDITVSSQSIADGGEKIRRGVRDAIHDAAQAGFAESQRRVPTAFGDLKESGELLRQEQSAVFGYRKEYARYVEEGTEPHYPPIDPLKEWAELVLGDRQAAYAVQQTIGQEGTDPQPFMRPARDAAARELRRRGISPSIKGQL